MIMWTIGYIVMAILVALVIAGYGDNGTRWGARRCVMLGAFWPVSLVIMGASIAYNKFINRGTR